MLKLDMTSREGQSKFLWNYTCFYTNVVPYYSGKTIVTGHLLLKIYR